MAKSLHAACATGLLLLLTASAAPQRNTRSITVEGLSFGYVDTGSGTSVILVHGFDVGLPRVVGTNGRAREAPSRDRVQPALSLAEHPTGERCRCNSSSADRRSCGYYQVIGTSPG